MKANIRLNDLKIFYQTLNDIEKSINGTHLLRDLDKNLNISKQGVYFFFEPGEERKESGFGNRVVRVGTHGLKTGSCSTLQDRLRQHRGNIKGKNPSGGNHRGSVFRKHVGNALINQTNYSQRFSENWGIGSSSSKEIRDLEYPIEKDVSKHIRSMPFIWIEINDPPGPESLRGYIERNSIALLSNYCKEKIDQPSSNWLGLYTNNSAIIGSGLWNVNHVSDEYEPSFLEILGNII